MQLDDAVLERTGAFARYGFLPELIGRFTRLVHFDPLDQATLTAILQDTVLADYRREFAAEQVELNSEPAVLEHVVQGALRRETGARGLRAALTPYLEEAAFSSFGGGADRVRLAVRDGGIVIE